MRFNLDRFVGILAVGMAAFLLWAMQHIDPEDFIRNLINYNSTLLWLYIVMLIVAAMFLSTERK